jgi:hypothetical protein
MASEHSVTAANPLSNLDTEACRTSTARHVWSGRFLYQSYEVCTKTTASRHIRGSTPPVFPSFNTFKNFCSLLLIHSVKKSVLQHANLVSQAYTQPQLLYLECNHTHCTRDSRAIIKDDYRVY